MRKITQEAVDAFLKYKPYYKDNTQIEITSDCGYLESRMYLYGHWIALLNVDGLEINHCGYMTNTTKERLNGIPGVCIQQKKGVWYLNGKEMLDGWNKV